MERNKLILKDTAMIVNRLNKFGQYRFGRTSAHAHNIVNVLFTFQQKSNLQTTQNVVFHNPQKPDLYWRYNHLLNSNFSAD
jgi:hypothetical protein